MKKQIKFALPTGIKYPDEPSTKKIATARQTHTLIRADMIARRGKSATAKWLCGTNLDAEYAPLAYRADNTKFGAFVRQMINVVSEEVASAAEEAKKNREFNKRKKVAAEQIKKTAFENPEQVEAANTPPVPAQAKLLRTEERDGCTYGEYQIVDGPNAGDVFSTMNVGPAPSVSRMCQEAGRAKRLTRGYSGSEWSSVEVRRLIEDANCPTAMVDELFPRAWSQYKSQCEVTCSRYADKPNSLRLVLQAHAFDYARAIGPTPPPTDAERFAEKLTENVAATLGVPVSKLMGHTPEPKRSELAEKYPQYYKAVPKNVPRDEVDTYVVNAMFPIDDPTGALIHARKKLLVPGVRSGGKDLIKDVTEARDTLNRWLALNG